MATVPRIPSAKEQQLLRLAKRELVCRQARKGDIEPYVQAQWPELELDGFQLDILQSLFDPSIREVFAKGNTGCGKSAIAGIAIAAWFDVFDPAKVVITSAQYEHAKAVVYGEFLKWWRARRLPGATYKPSGSECFDDEEHYVAVVNPAVDEAFSGRHSPGSLFVFDEGSSIPDSRYKLARTQAKKFFVMSNPRTVFGAFREAFACAEPDRTQTIIAPSGKRRLVTIGGQDCRNVREKRLQSPVGPPGGIEIRGKMFGPGELIPLDDYELVKPLIPGQTCYDTYLALASDPDPRWAAVFADGKFPDADPEKQLFDPAWFVRHTEWYQRWHVLRRRSRIDTVPRRLLEQILPVTAFGLDVGASKLRDETVLAAGGEGGVRAIHAIREDDTMESVGWVLRLARTEYGIELPGSGVPVGVDIVGVGVGVANRLEELGVNVLRIRGNDTPDDQKLYENERAERFATLAHRLNPKGQHGQKAWALPDDPLLLAELAAIEKVYRGSEGLRFGITPKEESPDARGNGQCLRAKLGRSPDRADAVSYLWAASRQSGRLGDWVDLI